MIGLTMDLTAEKEFGSNAVDAFQAMLASSGSYPPRFCPGHDSNC